MTNEALKSWLGAMPIDDVRRKIERLETKLSDLRVLERVYGDREQPQAEPEPPQGPATGAAEPAQGPATGAAEPAQGPSSGAPEHEGWGAQQG